MKIIHPVKIAGGEPVDDHVPNAALIRTPTCLDAIYVSTDMPWLAQLTETMTLTNSFAKRDFPCLWTCGSPFEYAAVIYNHQAQWLSEYGGDYNIWTREVVYGVSSMNRDMMSWRMNIAFEDDSTMVAFKLFIESISGKSPEERVR